MKTKGKSRVQPRRMEEEEEDDSKQHQTTIDYLPPPFKTSSTPRLEQQMTLFYRLKASIDRLQAEYSYYRACVRSFRSYHKASERYRSLMEKIDHITDNDDQNELNVLGDTLTRRSRQCTRLLRSCRLKSGARHAQSLYETLYLLYDDLLLTDCQPLPDCQSVCISESNIEIRLESTPSTSQAPSFFLCPLHGCSQMFETKENLLAHLYRHASEKKLLRNLTTPSVDIHNEKIDIKKTKKKGTKRRKSNSTTDEEEAEEEAKVKKQNPSMNKSMSTPHKKFPCSVEGCKFVSNFAATLKVHQLKHSNERPAKCEVCGKAFKDVYTLKTHLTTHNGRRFYCQFDDCSANYSTPRSLKKHISMIHTNDAPVYKCSWPACDYSTQRIDLLKKHRNVHTGERPYKCIWPDCGKAFKSLSTQHDHMLMHKNERKYKCTFETCIYSCNLLGNLRKHEAIHVKRSHKTQRSSATDQLSSNQNQSQQHLASSSLLTF